MRNPFETERWRHFYAQHRRTLWWGRTVILLVAGFAIAWGLGVGAASQPAEPSNGPPVDETAAGPSLWTCAMHPQIRQPKPGDCPICGMDLIPVPKASGGMRTLTVSPEAWALMNIASSRVERRYVTHQIPMVGKVDYDETKFGYITAWVPGRLDRLYVDYTGVQVNQGDHMVYIYSPELYSAQEELIQARKYRRDRQSTTTRLTPSIDLVESGREKLRLLGLTEAQIKEIEKQNKPTDHLTIYSPVSGIVIEKLKQEGEYVKTGERVYTVADLNQLWVHLDAYETDLPWIRYGQDVAVTTEAYPGEEFHGRIAFIQPVLNDKTRTVKVRVNVPNPDGKLKPDMFVHALVRPKVAAGGRVMDPSLAGKWISPMHPEIVKDEPGKCDVCGMPLVRAETLGYVTPTTDEKQAPLVIPYSAALVTGKRAIVYVELPVLSSGLETAFQGLAAAVDEGSDEQIQQAFAVFSNVLDRPYDQPGTDYAKGLWNRYSDRLAEHSRAGQRARSKQQAEQVFAQVERITNELREQFAAPSQPTFEGREIVLGPRAGDYYLVRHGLQEGEMVVTQGNFKIDAEVQIQAKPSMMTPQGGGGGGHDHGGQGGGAKKAGGDEHAGHRMSLPTEFYHQEQNLEAAYTQVADAVKRGDLATTKAAFTAFGEALDQMDESLLTGHGRMLWKEFAMLLGNDAVEGRDVDQMPEADRVFLMLKGHMRRMREQLGVTQEQEPRIERIAVGPAFQAGLARVWQAYLTVQQHLASDDFLEARQSISGLGSALTAVKAESNSGHADHIWKRERANLAKLLDGIQTAEDIKALRAEFKPLSEEIGVLAKTFGFGETGAVYQLHCPMVFEGRGAIWYQNNDQVRNPYYGSTMLKCADRVEQIAHEGPNESHDHGSHQDHSQH